MTEDTKALVRIETQLCILTKKVDDIEDRLRSVEKKQWLWSGGFVVFAGLWTAFSGRLFTAMGLT